MDQQFLHHTLESLNLDRDDPDLILIDQLATIKRLIDRPQFNLNGSQVKAIHVKFQNLWQSRQMYKSKQYARYNTQPFSERKPERYIPIEVHDVDQRKT